MFRVKYLDDPEALERGPASPSRLKSFLLACAVIAQEDHIDETNKLLRASSL